MCPLTVLEAGSLKSVRAEVRGAAGLGSLPRPRGESALALPGVEGHQHPLARGPFLHLQGQQGGILFKGVHCLLLFCVQSPPKALVNVFGANLDNLTLSPTLKSLNKSHLQSLPSGIGRF